MKIPNETVEQNEKGEKTLLIELTAMEAKIIRSALKEFTKYDDNNQNYMQALNDLKEQIHNAHNKLWPS